MESGNFFFWIFCGWYDQRCLGSTVQGLSRDFVTNSLTHDLLLESLLLTSNRVTPGGTGVGVTLCAGGGLCADYYSSRP